ncbi:hypothetical protein HMPREF0765_0743 [Sphingobacterium spiritivorum ATCC 33300]|uniref:Uncharacterized protein n=1 Tax=Sphingobacterium spiritivorum ATCC 33300 TaxID=525372 RepID=C2FTW1_SPHSI|nr:hypothetical protein HMPREF0765_0743 [Sphingobacterium spiritivorum ATCC 33300]MBB1646420.1 hypothetical protein [Sphingobacterium sp. UME9]
MFDNTVDSMSNTINTSTPKAISKHFVIVDKRLLFVPPFIFGGGTNFFLFLVFLLLFLPDFIQ